MDSPAVDILLAVYNGSAYLSRQLASIAAQTHQNWTILARDDGSTDNSVEILRTFAKEHPGKLKLIPTEKNVGVVGNFGALMQASTAPYASFCDQDDVWDPRKLEICLELMQAMEKGLPKEYPLLVHTDLRLVDEEEKLIAPSFWKFTRLYPARTKTLNRLLAQNVVTGCTLFCNRALLLLSLPIPTQALMHDWWIALVAAGMGKIGFIEQQTISYRQHGKNTLGAVKFGSWAHLRRAWERFHEMSAKKRAQAEVFRLKYATLLDEQDRQVVLAYASLSSMGFFRSRWNALRYGFFKQGLLRNIAAFVLLKQP